MSQESCAPRLDVRAFAQSAGHLGGWLRLTRFPRIADAGPHGAPGETVQWAARGEIRSSAIGQPQIWLHLDADCHLPRVCQRCLDTMQVHLHVGRWFRFVEDEASAAAQDETSEEDLLVLEPEFDLHDLIEDELLLELPYIARHDVCPTEPTMAVADPQFVLDPERPNPFSALASLKSGTDV